MAEETQRKISTGMTVFLFTILFMFLGWVVFVVFFAPKNICELEFTKFGWYCKTIEGK